MSALQESQALLDYAVCRGADECELTCVKRHTVTIRITDSKIAESKQTLQSSYGIRLIKEKRISSASTPDPARMRDMIDSMLHSTTGQSVSPLKFWRGMACPAQGPAASGAYDKRLYRIGHQEIENAAWEMINAADDRLASTVTGSINVVSEEFEICNTNQLFHADKAAYIAGFVNAESCVPSDAPYPDSVSGIGHSSGRTLAGFEPDMAGRDAREMCVRALGNPVTVDDNCRYTVIFEPYSVGELLAFVVAANFSLKRVSEKQSCFSRHMGRQIAPEFLTICDDPHAPDGLGSHPVDAEGVPTIRRPLIEAGVFTDTYADLFDHYKATACSTSDEQNINPAGCNGAAKDGHKHSGNAVRMAMPMGRSADPIPISAPHNMTIETRSDAAMSRDEMIRDVKQGLLIGRLWYTYAVNPIRGDFSCTARSGVALIRDGQIIAPAKPVRIMYNLPDLFLNISGVGDDARSVIQWASLPSITPSLRVENVPVRRI